MTTIAAYVVERCPSRVFVPAIALLAAAACWVATAPPSQLLVATGLTALLLVLFRLWDDIEDVDHDRLAHPTRVMVTSDRTPFRWLLAVLFVLAGLAFSLTNAGRFAFAGLAFAMWCAYRWLRLRLPDRIWRFGILLAKYPAFILLVSDALGGRPSLRLTAAMTAAYCGAAIYEASHLTVRGSEQ